MMSLMGQTGGFGPSFRWRETENGMILSMGACQICLYLMEVTQKPEDLDFRNLFIKANAQKAICQYSFVTGTTTMGVWNFPAAFAQTPYVFYSLRDDRALDGKIRVQMMAIGQAIR